MICADRAAQEAAAFWNIVRAQRSCPRALAMIRTQGVLMPAPCRDRAMCGLAVSTGVARANHLEKTSPDKHLAVASTSSPVHGSATPVPPRAKPHL